MSFNHFRVVALSCISGRSPFGAIDWIAPLSYAIMNRAATVAASFEIVELGMIFEPACFSINFSVSKNNINKSLIVKIN